MDFTFKPLTNVRPSKEKGRHLITNTTKGNMKLTPKAGLHVKVADGQYLGIVSIGGVPHLFKGSEDLGAKVASSKKGGAGDLNFSAAMGWEELGGNDNTKRYFTIADEPTEVPEEVVQGTPYEGKVLYALTFEKEEQKQKRKSSEDKEASVVVEESVTNAQDASDLSANSNSNDFEASTDAVDNNDFSDL